MYELKLAITIIVVCYVIIKLIAWTYTPEEHSANRMHLTNNPDFPHIKNITLGLLTVIMFVGGGWNILSAMWKLL